MGLLLDRWLEVDLAVCTFIARQGLNEEEQRRLDESVREAQRRSPSWAKTCGVVRAAIVESEESLRRKCPRARIRVRFVTVLYSGHSVGSFGKPISVDDVEFYERSRLPVLLREVNEFAHPSGSSAAGAEPAKPQPLIPTARLKDEEFDQAILILSHFRYLWLVDAEAESTRTADQLSTEAFRKRAAGGARIHHLRVATGAGAKQRGTCAWRVECGSHRAFVHLYYQRLAEGSAEFCVKS